MFQNIQILRAVAAVMVVLFHVVLWLPQPSGAAPLIHQIFHSWGKSGVDLFFVISGFVIMLSQARKPRSVLEFLRNRALRILPLYWALTAVFVLLLVFLPQLAANQPPLTAHRLGMSLGMVSWLTQREFPVVFVGWSLEYEMMFYLLFAVAGSVLALRHVPVVLGIVLGLGAWTGMFEQMVVEFVLGMMIARLRLARAHLPFALPILLAGIALFLLSIRWPDEQLRLLTWGLPSAMIVTGLVFLPQLKSRIGDYLGNASYAIYLGQALAIPAATKLVLALMPGSGFTAQVLVISVITVLLGCLLHALVERPLNGFLQGGMTRLRPSKATP